MMMMDFRIVTVSKVYSRQSRKKNKKIMGKTKTHFFSIYNGKRLRKLKIEIYNSNECVKVPTKINSLLRYKRYHD